MDSETRPHIKKGPVKYAKGYGWKLFLRRLRQIFLLLMVVAIVGGSIYTFAKQPVRAKEGYVEARIEHKFHRHGDRVIIVDGERKSNLFTPLLRVLQEQEVYRGEIIAGPYGEIRPRGDIFRVTEVDRGVDVDLKTPQDFLDNEYVVRKIDKDGEILVYEKDEIVTKDMILGFIK